MNINLIKFLITLKNASILRKEHILIKNNRLCLQIVKTLYKEGLIQSFKIEIFSNIKFLQINLRYFYEKSVFDSLKLLSTPSRKIYLSMYSLSKIKNNKKLMLFSTTKGILNLTDCKKKKIGGKLLFIC